MSLVRPALATSSACKANSAEDIANSYVPEDRGITAGVPVPSRLSTPCCQDLFWGRLAPSILRVGTSYPGAKAFGT
jgi:hypothetical protein